MDYDLFCTMDWFIYALTLSDLGKQTGATPSDVTRDILSMIDWRYEQANPLNIKGGNSVISLTAFYTYCKGWRLWHKQERKRASERASMK